MTDRLARACRVPGHRPGRLVAATGLACAVLYLGAALAFPKPGGRLVVGDAVHHFVYLRSLVFDGDLRFQNEYVRMYGLTGEGPETEWVYRPSATGHVRNMMPVGPAYSNYNALAFAPTPPIGPFSFNSRRPKPFRLRQR